MSLQSIVTKQEFDQKVLNSKTPVLVDFWAEWCPPCVAMSPVLKNVAEKLDGKAEIVKINIEESSENGALAAEYGVRSIPNMVVFKDGKEVDRIIGMTAGATIETKLLA
jgi:thioredoxin 1